MIVPPALDQEGCEKFKKLIHLVLLILLDATDISTGRKITIMLLISLRLFEDLGKISFLNEKHYCDCPASSR